MVGYGVQRFSTFPFCHDNLCTCKTFVMSCHQCTVDYCVSSTNVHLSFAQISLSLSLSLSIYLSLSHSLTHSLTLSPFSHSHLPSLPCLNSWALHWAHQRRQERNSVNPLPSKESETNATSLHSEDRPERQGVCWSLCSSQVLCVIIVYTHVSVELRPVLPLVTRNG